MHTALGSPTPLGPSVTTDGLNVAVYSSVAESVEVCFLDGDHETRLRLPGRTGDVHHGVISGVAPGTPYSLRVDGGQRLIDPFAPGVDLDALTSSHLPSPPPRSSRPDTPWSETVVYEAHVKGLTQLHPDVPETLRGTFLGAASEAIIAHLTDLGVTAIEFLPVAAFTSEPFLAERGLTQYWGYNPASFLAAHPAYATDGTSATALVEFVTMVDRFHDAGIEVLIDVVLNHTAEGPIDGPIQSLRGLDDRAYYRTLPDGSYDNITGTGNALDLSKQPALDLAIASLRHWAGLGVDGFRFDLASVLGRDSAGGFSPHADFFTAIDADPDLSGLKLIAEPWDIGPGGYQLGNYPEPWREWNDRFRDEVRRFWRSEAHALGPMLDRLKGSPAIFGDRPGTINYVTAHDGFTLLDLVSYERRNNLTNGEQNGDGHHDNLSWNSGYEGPTGDPVVTAVRGRRVRSMLATLLLADGTPMLLGGDELGRTQGGNNNAYCQDNELSWIDWTHPDRPLTAFVRSLVTLRKELDSRWADAETFDSEGRPLTIDAVGTAVTIVLPGEVDAVLVLNSSHHPVEMAMPDRPLVRRLDSSALASPPLTVSDGAAVVAPPFSLQVFLAQS